MSARVTFFIRSKALGPVVSSGGAFALGARFLLFPRRFWPKFVASRRSGGNGLSDELLVGQALVHDLRHGAHEARHVAGLAIVEPKDLLVHVAEQVERLDGDVGA